MLQRKSGELIFSLRLCVKFKLAARAECAALFVPPGGVDPPEFTLVHSNPAWIHPDTAKHFGLRDGDWIEIRGHRSESVHNAMPGLKLGTGEVGRRLRIPVVVTEGVHPKALAISNSLGHFHYTNVAQAKKTTPVDGERVSLQLANFRDPDWEQNMWWEDNSGGNPKKWRQNTGPGWAQNNVLAIMPDYISGQQSFNDTVVKVRKIT